MAEENKLRNRKKPSQNLEHGKLPPQAIDLEKAVLGALMIEPHNLFKVSDILHPKVFYKENHQKIYAAIIELEENKSPIDILTVTQQLKSNGELDIIGGPYYISQLTNSIASSANIEHHSMIVFQQFTKREQIRLGSEMITQAYDETVDVTSTNEMISIMANDLLTALEPNLEQSNSETLREITKDIEQAKLEGGITGLKSGFSALDDCTNGWQRGDLIYLAARPSMGKTAMALIMAKNMAIDFDTPGAFVTIEMTKKKLMLRLVSNATGFLLSKLQKGDLSAEDWVEYAKKIKHLTNDNLSIIEKTNNILSIKNKALKLYAEGRLKFLIVDYIQICRYPAFSKNKEREVAEISAIFKQLSLDLNIPVIVLSQMSREVEKRTNKKPQLSDLRDSGSIEQDGDVIMFLFRPSYYKMKDSPSNLALGIIAKHRNGDLKTIKFDFHGPTVTFKDWEGKSFDPTNPNGADGLPF